MSKKLSELTIDEVNCLLASWNLDRVLGPTFAEQQIDGELLADAELDDFDHEDFPKARNMHWKKFHRKLKHVRENGVSLDAISAAMASIDLPVSPKYSIAVATPIIPAIPVIAGTVDAPSTESSSKKAFSARLIEHVQTIDEMNNFSPIFNLREHPEEEVAEVLGQVLIELDTTDLAKTGKLENAPASVRAAESFAQDYCMNHVGGKTGLNKDRVAAITMLALETPFFASVNKTLSLRNRQKLLPYLGWVKLTLTGLYCLPLCPSTVYRGVRQSMKAQYRKGKRFINWNFLSASPSVHVINGVLGTKGNYTIFSIEATSLINISDFSQQEELLLLPGTMLIVTEVLELVNDVTIVHIKEDITARPMLDMVHPELEDRRPPDITFAAAATKAPASPRPSASADEDPPCCRICFEEGDDDNPLIIPCDCKGSMMFIHESCLFEWRAREKADKCNTCNSPYKMRQNICSGALYPRTTFNEMNKTQELEIADSGYTLRRIYYSKNRCTCVSSTGISVPKDDDVAGFAKYRWCLRVHVITKGALSIVNNLFDASKPPFLSQPSCTSSGDRVFSAGSILEVELDFRKKRWTLSINGHSAAHHGWPMPPGDEVFLAAILHSKDSSISFVDEKFPAFYPRDCTRFTGRHIVLSKLGREAINQSDKHDGNTAVLAGGVTVVGNGLPPAWTLRPTTTRWTVEIGPSAEDVIVGVVSSSFDASKHSDFLSEQNCFGYCQRDGTKSDGCGSTSEYGPSYRPGDKIGVEINPVEQTLRFFKNGKDLGVACDDLPMGIQFRLAVTLRNPRESVTCLPSIVNLASGSGFMPASWLNRHGKNIQIAFREATCNRTSWENCTVIANPSCIIPHGNRKGRFTWTFKVLKGHQITVGIVLPNFNPDEHDYINKTKLGWGYYQGDGKIGHGGPASQAYGVQYKVQEAKPMHVEVTIDMASKTLGFSVNGRYQGVAYRNLPTGVPLKAAVSLYKKGSKVQLLDAFRASSMDYHGWTKIGSAIKISGTVARKVGRNWDNGSAVVGHGVVVSPQARLRCSFRILRGTQTTLGVCTSSFDPKKDGYVNKTSRGWGYYQGDGKIGHNCSANKKYGKVLAAGDLVDVEIRGCSLHFWVNGEDQGPAFTNLPTGKTLYAAASLYNGEDAVQIVHVA